MWIDTHCHLDAAEFDADRGAVRAQARAQGVALSVIPAVERSHWSAVAQLAAQQGDAYALGIHPLYVPQASEEDLLALDRALTERQGDPRLVAVGEIGLDFFVPALCEPAMRERQWRFYTAQLMLAQKHQLPVILHVRRSADLLLKGLRQCPVVSGIAHAFNGSAQQAGHFVAMGFALGFGGALTYERALQLRRLACDLPLAALVLETDAPDMPPHWLYQTAEQRALGQAQGRNSPAELPRIAQVLADLRGLALHDLAQASTSNALRVLPKLSALSLTGG
ncbi:DNAase [Limnohabitans sp. MMS-10A-160]|uniref:TatD family hydrolase n=1 Tax=unclassified Limnohabitans TaxID=2626134 RepID=UPI000D3D9EEA|nr:MULTISPECIES: TatD family hydrolase [unclassified Limnohabitans]PUE18460.1 DNAase [Limnohabitans sp. MMS-10A-192]PUE23351.1 DNAase [Limnohabitans sp. MMS-10A-160]